MSLEVIGGEIPRAPQWGAQPADPRDVRFLGISSALFLPIEFVAAVRRAFEALRFGDRETLLDAVVSAWNIPVGVVAAFENILSLLDAIIPPLLVLAAHPNAAAHFTSVMTSLILKPVFITCGVFFTVIEIILEGLRLGRTRLFQSEMGFKEVFSMVELLEVTDAQDKTSRAKLLSEITKNEPRWVSRLGEETYLTLKTTLEALQGNVPLQGDYTTKLKTVLTSSRFAIVATTLLSWKEKYGNSSSPYPLASRVGALAAGTLNERFERSPFAPLRRSVEERFAYPTRTVGRISATEDAIQEGLALLRDMETQVTKITVVYVLGLIALSLALLGFILSSLGFPPLLLLPLTVVGIILALTRSYAFPAFIEQQGWQWNWTACVPEAIRNRFRKPLIEEELEEMRQISPPPPLLV